MSKGVRDLLLREDLDQNLIMWIIDLFANYEV